MSSSDFNGDIMVRKEIFWTIVEWPYFGLLPYYIQSDNKSIVSVIGWLTTDTYGPTFSFFHFWLISEQTCWETETRFFGRALMGKRSVSFLIHFLPDKSINGNASDNWWTQIDGDRDRWCLFQIPYNNIHLSIDQRKDKTEGGKISRKSDSGTYGQDRCFFKNTADGYKEGQKRIPTILAITILTITYINITLHL